MQGIGGLGHLGIQFARHMGFRTVAIGRGREKEKLAKDLGAHVYIDTAVDDAAAVLQRLGGARAILATGTSGDAMGPLVSGLAARGKLIVVGVPQDQIQLSAFSARLWRALDLRLTDRHGDRQRGHAGLQRSGEYPPDDRDSFLSNRRLTRTLA